MSSLVEMTEAGVMKIFVFITMHGEMLLLVHCFGCFRVQTTLPPACREYNPEYPSGALGKLSVLCGLLCEYEYDFPSQTKRVASRGEHTLLLGKGGGAGE